MPKHGSGGGGFFLAGWGRKPPAAAVLAGAIGDIKDAVVILIVVMFNACLGFYQEYRAEATLAALRKMLAQHARIRRGGEMWQIPAEELVPGDIVLLEAGDRVPAAP